MPVLRTGRPVPVERKPRCGGAALRLLDQCLLRATPGQDAAINAALVLGVLRPFLSGYEPAESHTIRDAAFLALDDIIAGQNGGVTAIDMRSPHRRVAVQPYFLRAHLIDWVENEIRVEGVHYVDLRETDASPSIQSTKTQPAPAPRERGFQTSDLKVAEEIVDTFMQENGCRTLWAITVANAHRADGKPGTSEESKTKRLHPLVKRILRTRTTRT